MAKHYNRLISIFFVAAFCVSIAITCNSSSKPSNHDHDKSPNKEPTGQSGICFWRVPPELDSRYRNGHRIDLDSDQQYWSDSSDLITTTVCCDYYFYNDITSQCERLPCRNGWYESGGSCASKCGGCQPNTYCSVYNVCECKEGYEKSSYDECHPVCRGDCTHGKCVEPGVCSCDRGYINPPLDRASCVPDCGRDKCEDGQCLTPGRCQPECRIECPTNARCKPPNECECNHGFEMDFPSNTCIDKSIFEH